MSIGPTEGVPGAGRVERPRMDRVRPAGPPPAAPPGGDSVEISETARLLSELLSLPAIREERVEELRRAFEEGRLETPERLEGAVDRFLSEQTDIIG